MALLFCDSFDHVSTYTQVVAKWGGGNVAFNPSTNYGRWGTQGMIISNGRYLQLIPAIVGTQTTGIFGGAFTATNWWGYFLQLYDATGGDHQVNFYLAGDGSLIVYRGRGNTQLYRTAAGLFALNQQFYLEVKVTIDNSAGVVQVWKDNVQIVNLSSQDTQNTANASFNTIYLGDIGGALTEYLYVDDVVLLNTSGSAPTNNRLGDVRVECLFPNGNGNTSQLVGQDADSTNNYLNVDETGDYDGDTTYNESSTVGNKDTYTYTNLTSTSGTVAGVQVIPVAKKTDAGTRTIASVARLSATEVDSADKPLSASYSYLPDIRETKPGSGAWAISDVNSAEFGVKVTA